MFTQISKANWYQSPRRRDVQHWNLGSAQSGTISGTALPEQEEMSRYVDHFMVFCTHSFRSSTVSLWNCHPIWVAYLSSPFSLARLNCMWCLATFLKMFRYIYSYKTLKSTWNSILHHIVDEHTWTEGGTEHSCQHPPLTDEDREKTMWLCKDSEAYQELASIVLNTTLQKDLKNMGRCKHTGQGCSLLNFVTVVR